MGLPSSPGYFLLRVLTRASPESDKFQNSLNLCCFFEVPLSTPLPCSLLPFPSPVFTLGGSWEKSSSWGQMIPPNPAYVGSPLLLAGVASRQPGNFGEARSSADDVGARGRGRLLSTREVISFAVPLIIICEVNKQQRLRLVEAWAWLSLSWLR